MENNILLEIYNMIVITITSFISFNHLYILTLLFIAPKEINVFLYIKKVYTLSKWEIIYNKALVDQRNQEIFFPTLNEIIKFPNRYHFEADETLVYCKQMTTTLGRQERETNLRTWTYPKEKINWIKKLLKILARFLWNLIRFV